MKAALLPDRGVVKVAGDGARSFLHGLVTVDILSLKPAEGRFCALLTPQGKIIADFMVTAVPAKDGGGFFLDVPRALAGSIVDKLNVYKLRAKVLVEDLSDVLGVLAVWNGGTQREHARCEGAGDEVGPRFADPRLPTLGLRVMLPPQRAAKVAAALDAALVESSEYEAHRIGLGVPRGGLDFTYGDAFPHETDMDQFGGIDFNKGCYVGQEVVSRMEHRGSARTRAVPVRYGVGAPEAGVAVLAGERQVGTMGSAACGNGIALLRLDRVAEAHSRGEPLTAGGVPITVVKPDWARFAVPDDSKAAE
jgi:tRNA-modifying protein YgfZ